MRFSRGFMFSSDSCQHNKMANNYKPGELFYHVYLQNTEKEELHKTSDIGVWYEAVLSNQGEVCKKEPQHSMSKQFHLQINNLKHVYVYSIVGFSV